MHRMTKMTAIPAKVKAIVAQRDCAHGPATCIICGAPGGPHCHIIRRSQGGMGVEQNIVTLCGPCHYALDEGLFLDRLRPLGLDTQKKVREYVIDYIKGFTRTGRRRASPITSGRIDYGEAAFYPERGR